MSLPPNHLDTLFQALGDPTRRAILERLSQGPASVSDIAAPFDMTMPAVLIHLRKLEDAGLVSSRKKGRVRTLSLNIESYSPAQGWLDRQRAEWEARLDRLERFALSKADKEHLSQ